jgi:hypothetical protein
MNVLEMEMEGEGGLLAGRSLNAILIEIVWRVSSLKRLF